MRLHDDAEAWVNVEVEVFDVSTGALLHRQETHNRVVDAGLEMIRDLIYGDTVAFVSHFALGTGSTAVTALDTELETEVVRDALTTRVKDGTGLKCHYYLGSGTGNGNTLTEAGLFNDDTAGTLYARVVLGTSIPKTASIAVAFTWTLTWGAA